MNGNNVNASVGTSVVCYFCNEAFGNSKLLEWHLKQCGSTLVPCRRQCGAWSERRLLQSHELTCPARNGSRSMAVTSSLPRMRLPSNGNPAPRQERTQSVYAEGGNYIQKEIMDLRLGIETEKAQVDSLKNEISKMKRQYGLSEERNQILLATIATLRRTIEDEAIQKNNLIVQIRRDVDNIRERTPDLSGMISQLELRVDGLQQAFEREQIERSHLELILNGQDGKLRSFAKLESDVEELKNNIENEKEQTGENLVHLQRELSRIESTISSELSASNRNLHDIEQSQDLILNKLQQHSDDAAKYQVLHYESKSLKGTVEEDNVRISIMEKELGELKSSLLTFQRERFTAMTSETNSGSVFEDTGHLIWRISDFEDKLKDCIENESVLLSPVFLSSKYGYTLQAEMYLNGVGKWRGRHITASVFVIEGNYDPLLQWPASLQASFILKDQAPKKSQSMDIVKILPVKKKENQDVLIRKLTDESDSLRGSDRRRSQENLSSSERDRRNFDSNLKKQYVFIPHTSLDKFDYIKNNVMFVEILVTSN